MENEDIQQNEMDGITDNWLDIGGGARALQVPNLGCVVETYHGTTFVPGAWLVTTIDGDKVIGRRLVAGQPTDAIEYVNVSEAVE